MSGHCVAGAKLCSHLHSPTFVIPEGARQRPAPEPTRCSDPSFEAGGVAAVHGAVGGAHAGSDGRRPELASISLEQVFPLSCTVPDTDDLRSCVDPAVHKHVVSDKIGRA